ncbi:hypothetical protein RI844_13735 [Thalassotalea fonticola]|uniref:DUF695 domain-containing protein n=1 Tax=Thalassotalea fonticola TaxID=3065649 RepID=A0ABZ0GKN5_9GAMM|nr:hypothetical protein RI844_13735 [Colwelliaceae bacterium S1-1]
MSPLNHFNSWFSSLIPAHKSDIAFMLVVNLPGFDSNDVFDLDNLVDLFEKTINELFEDGKSIGVLISIRGAIDFYFSNRRDRKEFWDSYRLDALYEAEKTGDNELKIEANSASIRHKQWILTLSKWYELKGKYLNDEALYNWKESEKYA